MQAIKTDNDIRSSLSITPFGKYSAQLGSTSIYVCSHSLSGESLRIFITLGIDCIEIKGITLLLYYDYVLIITLSLVWNQRLFREATLAISFATVNALIVKFISQYESSHRIELASNRHDDDNSNNYTNMNRLTECWDAIARSVTLNDYGNVTISTQHIVYFTPGNLHA